MDSELEEFRKSASQEKIIEIMWEMIKELEERILQLEAGAHKKKFAYAKNAPYDWEVDLEEVKKRYVSDLQKYASASKQKYASASNKYV